jgi:molecular chaperone GrpE
MDDQDATTDAGTATPGDEAVSSGTGTPESVTDGGEDQDAAANGARVDPTDVPAVDDGAIGVDRGPQEIVAEVADLDAGAGSAVAALVERIAELEAERAELEEEVETVESQLKRKQADFENYKKRAKREQERVKEQAAADLVERMLSIRDDLARALEDAATDEEATVQEGVRMTLSEFDRILNAEGVDRIEPEPGDQVDPEHHEVIARVDGDTDPGTIDEQHRPGYRMHGSVLREAQVTVTDQDGGE